MADIVLDDKSIYYMARGLRARQAILDERGSIDDANEAFEKEFWMPYDTDIVCTAIEEHPNLNAHLITFLEARFRVRDIRKNGPKDELDQAVAAEIKEFDQFEFLRRMTAFDCKSLRFSL